MNLLMPYFWEIEDNEMNISSRRKYDLLVKTNRLIIYLPTIFTSFHNSQFFEWNSSYVAIFDGEGSSPNFACNIEWI